MNVGWRVIRALCLRAFYDYTKLKILSDKHGPFGKDVASLECVPLKSYFLLCINLGKSLFFLYFLKCRLIGLFVIFLRKLLHRHIEWRLQLSSGNS